MTTNRDRHRVPQLLLERLALEELAPGELEDVKGRLDQEAGGEERLRALLSEDEAILADYPPAAQAARIKQRFERERRRRRLVWIAAPLAAAAVVLLLVLILPLLGDPTITEPPGFGTRDKCGSPMIAVFRKDGQQAEELQAGNRVAQGDLLQITYTACRARHGVIFSLDGRGKVTLHFPDEKDRSTALAPGGPHALPFSYELDDAPRYERFFFVTSKHPINVDAVLERAHALDPDPRSRLSLPRDLRAKELLLRKRSR
jgi:hypothetical protein